MQKRQTAYKIWINDLLNNNYVKQAGEWEPNYVEFNGMKVARVNLIASVVFKFKSEDNNYVALTLDDNSGSIRVKVWGEDVKLLDSFEAGDIVLVIGRVREFNNEIYINPEIVKKMDPNWELVRKLELIKEYGKPEIKIIKQEVKEEVKEVVEEEVIDISESSRQKIINLIESLSDEHGVKVDDVVKESELDENEAEGIIQDLLKEGEIFQPKANFLKLIE